MDIEKKIDWLRERLQQPLPGLEAQLRMVGRVRAMPDKVPDTARASAVLCLLYPIDGVLHMLLIKRVEDGKAHSGQISFPGGRQDPWDADLRATALREANEEVGVMSADVDIIGALTPLYIPISNFQVYPFVAYTQQRPSFNLSVDEVSYVLEIPVDLLLHPSSKTVLDVRSPAIQAVIKDVHAYQLPNAMIWGATAMMISELEAILQEYA